MLLILITYLSIYFSFEARASEAEPQVESSSKPVTPDSKPVTPEKKITIQIGAFTSLRKAALMRSILKPMGPVQVEKIRTEREETLYRVLIGEFKTLQDAKTYVQKHHLKELFQNVWVNPVALEPGEGKEVIPNEVLDQDPYFVHVELNCEEKKHYGAYNFELQPSEGDSNKDIEVTLNWNCIADNRERWLAKDEQRSPSHISLTPLLGAGSLTMNDSVLGSMNRFDFSYGVQVTGFRSFGGIGPTFEYRLLNHRYSSDGNVISPLFVITHRFLVGARLPISHRIEFQPLFGFYNEYFLQGSSTGTASFVDPLLTQVAMRGTIHLIEINPGTWFDLIAGFHYLLPATTPTLTLQSGIEWNGRIQTSHFFRSNWGVNWFFEYSSRTITATTFSQNNTLFLTGVSLLLGF